MPESQPDRQAVVVGSAGDLRGNGQTSRLPDPAASPDPLDRSHMLRRANRFPFPHLLLNGDHARLRRERRVSASFSGIPPLSRNGRD